MVGDRLGHWLPFCGLRPRRSWPNEVMTDLDLLRLGDDGAAPLRPLQAALGDEFSQGRSHGGPGGIERLRQRRRRWRRRRRGLAEMLCKPYLRASIFVIGLRFLVQITGSTRSSTAARGSSS